MTHRERWLRTMRFEPVDHVPDEEFGYWDNTLTLWHEEGLPREIDSNEKADVYFGFAPRGQVPVDQGPVPGFEQRVLEERGDYVLIQDEHGATCEIHKSGQDSIPHFVDFMLKGREEWEREFKPRLNPEDLERRPEEADWERMKGEWEGRDYPLGIGIGSLYGWMRDWMGFERAAMMVYDDRGLVEEVMEQITQVVLGTIEWAAPQVELDFAAGWEDMCFKNGPMISPATFEEMMVPRYRRITELLRKHGCDIVYTDCDGNINQLVGLWLEAGINCMFPVEVAAGSDPIALRDKHGKDILLLGGVNKRALIAGKEAIRKEVKRIAPYVREGGWIPHVDHRVPADVTLENYRYYLALKRETFGIPEPGPWEERRPAEWGGAAVRGRGKTQGRSGAEVVTLRSAGGVVVKGKGETRRVAVVQSQYETWVFPKGLIEEGEEPEEAARREVGEETGLRRLRLRGALGWTQHEFEREGKRFRNRIYWFLYEVSPRAAMRLDPEEEILDCGWFSPKQAMSVLSHANQRRLLRRAMSRLLKAEAGRGV